MDDIKKQKERASLFFKYTMHYGLLMGLYLIFVFLIFVWVSGYDSVGFMYLGFIPLLFTPFLAYIFLRKYRDDISGGQIKFSQAWNFGSLMFFFAGLILAIALYIILEYIKPGLFTDILKNFSDMLENSLKQIPEGELNSGQVEMVRSQIKQLSEIPAFSAIEIAINNLWNCLFFGIILSIPVAFFVKKGPKSANMPTL